MPAHAGIQVKERAWIPAFAGMTWNLRNRLSL